MGSTAISAWTVSQVSEWLAGLELPQPVVASFEENAVSGADLEGLSDDDLINFLQCKPLQARKIRTALNQLGVPAPPSAGSGPATPSVPSSASLSASNATSAAPAVAAPAAAPSAPLFAEAPAEPDPVTCFQPGDLQRYAGLQGTIAELEGMQIPSRLSQAKQYADSVQQQLAGVQRSLPAAHKKVAAAKEEYDKYASGKWYPGKNLGSKESKAKKEADAKAALDQAAAALQREEQLAVKLEGDLREGRKMLAAWQGKAAELSTAQASLKQLEEGMFSAPAWRASPRQSELADAMRVLEGQAAEAHRGHTTYGRGNQLLRSAADKLEEALEALGRTQMVGALQMGRGMGITLATGRPGMMQPGRLMGDMVELAIFRRANDMVASAAKDTEEARQLLPGLPKVDQKLLNSARAGLFQNILFGGMMSDMIQLAAVRRAMEDVREMRKEVKEAARWAGSNLAVYQQQDAALAAQLASKHGELSAFRRQALQTALAAMPPPAAV